MKTTSYSLYDFLTDCAGTWRNAIFIACTPCRHPCKNQRCGHLLSADRDGRPHLISVRLYEQATGKKIDPAECVGKLDRSAFAAAYRTYLLWELDDAGQCPLRCLSAKINT